MTEFPHAYVQELIERAEGAESDLAQAASHREKLTEALTRIAALEQREVVDRPALAQSIARAALSTERETPSGDIRAMRANGDTDPQPDPDERN